LQSGGIFLTGTGDYNPSINIIDLHGMKINGNGNKATTGGYSLFVVIKGIIELC
jgi:hypothetical protein